MERSEGLLAAQTYLVAPAIEDTFGDLVFAAG
jgi:hypothetical protein